MFTNGYILVKNLEISKNDPRYDGIVYNSVRIEHVETVVAAKQHFAAFSFKAGANSEFTTLKSIADVVVVEFRFGGKLNRTFKYR
jgi:hypothetical protein